MKLTFNTFMVHKTENEERYELTIINEFGIEQATMEFTNVNDLWHEIGKLLKGDLV